LQDPESFDAVDLAVDLARRRALQSDLGRALKGPCTRRTRRRSARYLEEAVAALAASELDVRLARVRRRSRSRRFVPRLHCSTPDCITALAAWAHRRRARAMADSLAAQRDLDAAHRELATFLRAEALDAVMGRRRRPGSAARLLIRGSAHRARHREYCLTRYADALRAVCADARRRAAWTSRAERVALAAAESA
jgi:hypothetical protein